MRGFSGPSGYHLAMQWKYREARVKHRKSHWRRWLVFLVGLPLVIYVGLLVAVRNSDAYAAAQAFASDQGLFDPGESPRLGWRGLRISTSGRSGKATFDLVGVRMGREQALQFIVDRDRRSGDWRVSQVSADQRRTILHPTEGSNPP